MSTNVIATHDGRESRTGSCASRMWIRCAIFGPGREDWNRGLRMLRRVITQEGSLARLADGTLCLRGLPGVHLRLAKTEIARIRDEGLRLASGDLTIEVDAADFRSALASLPPSGAVIPFSRLTRHHSGCA